MAVGDRFFVAPVVDTVNQRAVNLLHYRVASETGTGVTAAEVATHMDPIYANRYKAVLRFEETYRGVQVGRYFPLPPGLVANGVASAGPGSVITQELLPTQVAGIVSWRTAFRGRAFRGRIYIPFPNEGQSTNAGLPTAAVITAWGSLGFDLRTTQNVVGAGGTATLVAILQSRKTLTTATDIISHVARPYWGTVRRRGSASGIDIVGPLV